MIITQIQVFAILANEQAEALVPSVQNHNLYHFHSVMCFFLNLLYKPDCPVREVRIFLTKSCFGSIDPVQNGDYDNLSPSDQRILLTEEQGTFTLGNLKSFKSLQLQPLIKRDCLVAINRTQN